jgi:hypothetical protein
VGMTMNWGMKEILSIVPPTNLNSFQLSGIESWGQPEQGCNGEDCIDEDWSWGGGWELGEDAWLRGCEDGGGSGVTANRKDEETNN